MSPLFRPSWVFSRSVLSENPKSVPRRPSSVGTLCLGGAAHRDYAPPAQCPHDRVLGPLIGGSGLVASQPLDVGDALFPNGQLAMERRFGVGQAHRRLLPQLARCPPSPLPRFRARSL